MFANRADDFLGDDFDSDKAYEAARETYIKQLELTLSFWSANRDDTFHSLHVLDRYVSHILGEYAFVFHSETGHAGVAAEQIAGSIDLAGLVFWRMSKKWLVIRSPIDGSWHAVYTSDVEPSMFGWNFAMDLAGYVILLMFLIWPETTDWRFENGSIECLGGLGLEIHEAEQEGLLGAAMDGDASEYDMGEVAEEFDIDKGFSPEGDSEERRRMAIMKEARQKLLGELGTDDLANHLTPWDDESWPVTGR